MGKSKELSEDIKRLIIESHKCGNGYNKISKQFGLQKGTIQKIVKKWKTQKSVANVKRSGRPSKISPRMKRNLLRDVEKNPRLTSKDLQQSLSSAGVNVHSSTIRRTMAQNGYHGCKPRRKPLLSKKNVSARLKYAQDHMDKPQAFWDNVLWTDESKIELFSYNHQRYVWRKKNTAFEHKNLVPTVKHGGGSIMVWGCFSSKGPGQLALIDGRMDSVMYQQILDENIKPSIQKLKLRRGSWVLQQDNDPKHCSKSTQQFMQKNKYRLLPWPSQSPDLNPIEMLWQDLKKAVHLRKPSNIQQLKQFCKEEWSKISSERCQKLVHSYQKRLQAVIEAKGGSTSY